ncbi:zonadhesin-like isoform X2 [Teleopsis dalmanni]|uniref:zonadhesin-like isoform X2 n=1 Tax=Teleopsis dalmanni TaxID=139649 RepID=UPI0018CF6888|nr:zonadhesin-like isoform X2 [Teleopsis dalmanni]
MLKLTFLMILTALGLTNVSAICNACNDNGVACISQNEFQVCIDGVADTSKSFTCTGANELCTTFGRACMDPTATQGVTITPACGDISKCGVCTDVGPGGFTCTSRTSYTMCSGGSLTDVRGYCPDKYICNVNEASSGTPCVLEGCNLDLDQLCDLSDPIDGPIDDPDATTTAPPEIITPPPEIITPPPEIITPPPEIITPPPEIITPPPEIITPPPEIITPPPEIITPPPEIITPPPEITTPEITTPPPELCDSTPATTTTVPPGTLPTPNEVCSRYTASGRYPYPRDTGCTNYVYCFWKGGYLQGTAMTCPAGLYFSAEANNCINIKPATCV